MTLAGRRDASPTTRPKQPGERRGAATAPAGGTIGADPDRVVVDVSGRARGTDGASRAAGHAHREVGPEVLKADTDTRRHVQDAGTEKDEGLSLELIRTLLAA